MKMIKLMICLFVSAWPVPLLAQTAVPPTLLITEVYYNTPGDDAVNEWIEIANVGSAAIDLSAISLGDAQSSGSHEGMVRFPKDARIEAGQVVVVAQTAVSFRQNFGFNPDYEITDTDPAVPDMRRYPLWASGDVGLANDGDEVLLLYKLAPFDAINYGDSEQFFTPAINGVLPGQSIERVPADCDTDSAAGWLPREFPHPRPNHPGRRLPPSAQSGRDQPAAAHRPHSGQRRLFALCQSNRRISRRHHRLPGRSEHGRRHLLHPLRARCAGTRRWRFGHL
ncbi:MAG: lamin tail domain-containing protein [Chloroflexi bacterium]|nr:lamin tail domain-containing protein [Chloroflexota bacterium]